MSYSFNSSVNDKYGESCDRVRSIMSEFDDYVKSTIGGSFRSLAADLETSSTTAPSTSSATHNNSTIKPNNNNDDSDVKIVNFNHKIQIKRLQRDFDEKEKAYKKVQIDIETQNKNLTMQNQQWKEKYETLKIKNDQLTNNFIKIDTSSKTKVIEKENTIKDLQNQILQIHQKNDENRNDLQDRMQGVMMENDRITDLNRQLQHHISELSSKQMESQHLMLTYKQRAEESASLSRENDELRHKVLEDKQKIQQLEQQLSDNQSINKMKEHFSNELNRLKELEAATQKYEESKMIYRKQEENVMLLKERLIAKENEVSRAQEKLSEFDRCKIENEILLEKMEEMKKESHSHESLIERNTALDEANSQLSQQIEELRQQLAMEAKHRNNERHQSSILHNTISKDKSRRSTLEEQNNRLKKHLGLVTEERNSLRSILQSYDVDLTSTTHHNQLQKRLKTSNDTNEKLRMHIAELEHRIQKSSGSSQEEGEKENVVGTTMSGTCQKCLILTGERDELKEMINQQSQTIEELQGKIDVKILEGDFNPDSTKVLHFKMNPVQKAQDDDRKRVEELQTENLKLQRKLKEVQQGHEVSMSEVMMSRQAKKDLELSELRYERLKETFIKKSRQLQQACYSLFGYRIETVKDGQFKLLSIYAESQQDYLIFQMEDQEGAMQLIETPYSQRLGNLIRLHLHQQNSIPIFLCALSLELFGDQTIY